MKSNYTLPYIFFLLFIFLFSNVSFGQYDVSNLNTTPTNTHSISSDFDFVYGMTFNDDGTKVYVVGYSNPVGFGSDTNKIGQYNLSAAYDLSSVASNTILDITSHNISASGSTFGIIPTGISFNNDGSKMFVIGRSTNDFALLFEYPLNGGGTAYNISDYDSTSIDGAFLPSFPKNPESIIFNPSGSSFYVIIADDQTIYEYSVSTNFDITSTVTQTQSFSVNTQESNPKGMTFNSDGSALFVIGEATNQVHQYALSTAFSVDGASFTQSSASISANDGSNNDVIFNNDGTKLFTVGDGNDAIYEYEITVPISPATPATITPRLLYNGPTSYDVSSLTDSPSSNIAVSTELSNSSGFVFNNDGTRMYIVGTLTTGGTTPFDPVVSTPKILEYILSTAYNISSATLNNTLDISSHSVEDADYSGNNFSIIEPTGIAFSEDGTKMFVIGLTSLGSFSGILEYPSSGTAFNLSDYDTTNIEGNLNINFLGSQIRNPQSIQFNGDGTKMYISDIDDDNLTELNLGAAYDITSLTTLSFNFSVNTEEADITDAVFNFNGSKLLVVGASGDDINQYDLSTNYSLSSASYSQTSVKLTADSSPQGIAFKEDGTQLILLGDANDRLYNYDIPLGNYEEASENDGSIDNTNPLQIQLLGATLKSTLAIGSDVTITYDGGTIPSGLTAVISVSNNIATLTFTGNASPHGSVNNITNISFVFADSAFTDAVAADIANSGSGGSYSSGIGILFTDCNTNIIYNGAWSGGNAFGQPDDTDIAKGMNIQSDVTIITNASCDCLIIDEGVTLTIANNTFLTVANSFELKGNIVLNNGSQLKQNHTDISKITGTGTLSIPRATSLTDPNQYAYWTSPVSTSAGSNSYSIGGVLKDGANPVTFNTAYDVTAMTSDPITLSSFWLYTYVNGANDATSWLSIDETATLNTTEGFTIKPGVVSGKSYTYTGSPNDGTITSSLTGTNYSMLGNPYPSALDANQFIEDNAVTNSTIFGTLYFYEAGSETDYAIGDGGGYATYNFSGGVGVGSTSTEVGSKTPQQYIPVGQGFFVSGNSGGLVTFNNAQRALQTEGGSSVFLGKSAKNNNALKENNQYLRIGFDYSNDDGATNNHRQVLIGFNGNTQGFENAYDGVMFGQKPTDLALSIENHEKSFVILGTEYYNEDLEFPLRVYIEDTKTVHIGVDATDLTNEIYLKDTLTSEIYDITNAPKNMVLESGEYLNRFVIVFKTQVLSTPEISLANEIKVAAFNHEILTTSTSQKIEKISIYNVLGQSVINFINEDALSEIKLNTTSLQTGVYIVHVTTEQGVFNKKVKIE